MAESASSLDKNSLGFWELLFQSISHISPIGAMIANMTAIAAYAGRAMPMVFIFAAIAFGFLLIILVQFSQRVVSAGGFYGYVRAGLGARWGTRSGWLMVLTYWMVVNFASLFAAGVLIPQTAAYFFGVHLPTWTWLPLMVGVQGAVWGMAYLGIKTSLRYSMTTMAVGAAVMAAAAVAIVIHAGPANNPSLFFNFSALHGAVLSGVGVGIIFAMLSLGGASSAIYLAEETPTPRRTVTRALVWAFGLCAALFLLTAYALTVGWGPAHMATFATANLPGVVLTHRAAGAVLAGLLVFFAFNATFTGQLAPANAVIRIVFAMARDQSMFPSRLAFVHPVRRSPSRAIAVLSGAGFIVSMTAGLVFGPFTGFAVLAISSTVAHFICHIMVAVSLPVYESRRAKMRVLAHLVPAAIGSALILTAFYLIMFPVKFPVEMGPIIVAAWWLIGEWRLRTVGPTPNVAQGTPQGVPS